MKEARVSCCPLQHCRIQYSPFSVWAAAKCQCAGASPSVGPQLCGDTLLPPQHPTASSAGDEIPGLLGRRVLAVCSWGKAWADNEKQRHSQTFSHQKSGHNKHLSAEEEKVFQHQLSGEWEESRAAEGDVSSHCFSQALCPTVRNFSKSPFKDETFPARGCSPEL